MSTLSFVEEIVSMEGKMLADEIVKGRFTQCVVAVPIKRIFTKKKEEDIYIFSGKWSPVKTLCFLSYRICPII